ncbi:MAG: hypothetical protein F4Y38_09845 [Gemmatimonadetes bacterium]|nr:hypothetical protein [Gemmatimonadota bacterium]MYI06490.1 hypothetical protein [Gemmatimonadota bacterium]
MSSRRRAEQRRRARQRRRKQRVEDDGYYRRNPIMHAVDNHAQHRLGPDQSLADADTSLFRIWNEAGADFGHIANCYDERCGYCALWWAGEPPPYMG